MNTIYALYGAFDPVPGPWDLRVTESAVVTAERDQQNANPEHATNLRVRAEGSYHDDREEPLTTFEARRYRLHADIPEPDDAWAGPPTPLAQCWRCEAWFEIETGCPHGSGYCAECSDKCSECEDERQDHAQERQDDHWRETA